MPQPIELAALDADFVQDPYPVYAALRRRSAVHHVRYPGGEEAYLVVGHAAARAALTEPLLSRDWIRHNRRLDGIDPAGHGPVSASMLDSDPPHHTRLRRLVSRAFTPGRVAALAPRVQAVTDELLDAMLAAPDRRADLVDALAFPLPMTVICELLGVPDLDRASFRAWSAETVAPTSPENGAAAIAAASDYLAELIAAKRRAPGADLLSGLIETVDEGGDRLSEGELLEMAFLLLVAGHETTVNLIGNGVRALFHHPDQLAALRADPDGLVEGAVEEMLRYDGPVETATPRIATAALEIDGTRIPAGATVMVALADADRDPDRFARPDRFDVRRETRGHIAFGHGIHYCLGAPLARLEGRIAIRTLLARAPGLAPDGRPAEWIGGPLIHGVRRIPVRW
ncbi:cytochrome P450 [Streptomyces sp. NPDC060194]|uniref:cytochrome P450 family protein n=1 Tax=Streptomyces sp. NPDC060194 TaxID=3347069 RepID=UPI00365E8586